MFCETYIVYIDRVSMSYMAIIIGMWPLANFNAGVCWSLADFGLCRINTGELTYLLHLRLK